jgi:alkylhydroperoxidase family enzyme
MSRIRTLTAEELKARGVDPAPFLKDFDELPNSIGTLAYHPQILAATLGLWDAVMHAGRVPADLKYMAGYLASMSAGCRYCSAHTATNAHRAGASAEKLEAIWSYETSPLFSDAERAALAFAQAAGQSPSAVTDADFAAMRRFYSDEDVLEILSVVALYGFFNRWNDALATTLESHPRGFAEAHLKAHGWDVGRHG